MSYGRNFGMRSFENVIRVGRFKAPATGTPFFIGAPIVIDEANPGVVRAAAADDATAGAGVAVYEHIQVKTDTLISTSDAPYNQVPLAQYVQIVHGPGTKVWFKNTPAVTLYDGRVRPAVTMVAGDITDLAPGDGLSPNGDGQFVATAADGTAWLTVEQVNPTTGLVEARFNF